MLLIFSLTDPNTIGQLQDVDMSATHDSGASPFSEMLCGPEVVAETDFVGLLDDLIDCVQLRELSMCY